MKLNQLSDNPGATKDRMRVGRGIGSGKGKTSGRGVKGQKARSGGNIMPGFEGGQNPLYKRLPMRGFNNSNFRTEYTIVNVGQLQQMIDDKRLSATKEINIDAIIAAGVTKKAKAGLKILATGELKSKVTINAAAASAAAVEKIKKAGGSITLPESSTADSK